MGQQEGDSGRFSIRGRKDLEEKLPEDLKHTISLMAKAISSKRFFDYFRFLVKESHSPGLRAQEKEWLEHLADGTPRTITSGCCGPAEWGCEERVVIPYCLHVEGSDKWRLHRTKIHFRKIRGKWFIEGKENPEAHEIPLSKRETDIDLSRLISLAHVKPASLVLDVGTGGGTIPKLLGARVTTVGLETWREELRSTQKDAAEDPRLSRAVWLLGDGRMMPLAGDQFDLVTIFACLMFVKGATDKELILQESYRVLKPGARLVLAEPIISDPAKDLPINFRISPKDLGELSVGTSRASLQQPAESIKRMLSDAGFVIAHEHFLEHHFEFVCCKQ